MPEPVKNQVLRAFASEVEDREDALQALLDQMQRYGKVVNLTGSLESDALWREFAEALLGYRALRAVGLTRHRWMDIGSGGGLPGLLFGVLLKASPDTRGLLIEPRKRRVDFLKLTIAQLSIPNLRVLQTSLGEDGHLATGEREPAPDWVSARAVFSPDAWLARAGKAWPLARCMVHGTASEHPSRQLLRRETWQDHRVEIWGPLNAET